MKAYDIAGLADTAIGMACEFRCDGYDQSQCAEECSHYRSDGECDMTVLIDRLNVAKTAPSETERLRKALSAMMTCVSGACADCVACEETDTDGIFLCRFDQWLEELGIVTPEEVDV